MGLPITRRTATALLLAAMTAPAVAATATAAIKVPTRGFNLPNWLAADPRIPSAAVLDKLRTAGFETIRLPVGADIATTPGFADRVADVLATVTRKGFNAILDLFSTDDFGTDFAAAADRADAAWTVLADVVVRTSPANVYPELLNEPAMSADEWATLRRRLAATVRAKCPDHTLVWGPARYQGIWELDGLEPLADRNAIVSVHYYTPMGFTHQGENWDETPLARFHGLPFPATRDSPAVQTLFSAFKATGDSEALDELDREFTGDWTASRIADDFADLAKWSKRHRAPVMLDEFGVLDFSADPISRANWVHAVRQAAEANGVGWTYWEADHGFGFIADRQSTEGFDQNLIAALLA